MQKHNKYETIDKYILEGGMSGSYLYKDQESKYNYITDVFDTLIICNIRKNIRLKISS